MSTGLVFSSDGRIDVFLARVSQKNAKIEMRSKVQRKIDIMSSHGPLCDNLVQFLHTIYVLYTWYESYIGPDLSTFERAR
jgi:hypothetical protein